jgi:hypothetical protein
MERGTETLFRLMHNHLLPVSFNASQTKDVERGGTESYLYRTSASCLYPVESPRNICDTLVLARQ